MLLLLVKSWTGQIHSFAIVCYSLLGKSTDFCIVQGMEIVIYKQKDVTNQN